MPDPIPARGGNVEVYPDGLPVPRRYGSIAAILLTMCLGALEANIANVGLPSITQDLHAAKANAIWVINAYQIATLVGLLPLAALAERVGCKLISQAGLVLFTFASVACAFADSLLLLSIARALQGLGAAGMIGTYGALMRLTYPQNMLGRAIGLNTLTLSLSSVIAPTLASGILAIADWRWLFASIVPLAILAFVIGALALPEAKRAARPFSYLSTLLNIGTFGLLMCGIQGLSHPEATPLALAQIAGGALLAYAYVRHELGKTEPVLPFDLLRLPRFSLSIATAVASFVAVSAALVALPFEIERLGYGAAAIGLLLTPWPVATTIAAPFAGRMADRYSADILCGIGLSLLGAGMLSLALYPPGSSVPNLLWRTALCGLGFGLFHSPNNRIILTSAPLARSGAAGAMQGVGRLLGLSVGATGVAILFRFFPHTGSHVALWTAAIMAFTAAGVSLARLRFPRAVRG